MKLRGNRWSCIPLRNLRVGCFVIASLFLTAATMLRAQGPGGDAPPVPPSAISIRPILVEVQFEGNETLTDEQLQASILTRATHTPLIKRYFTLLADFAEATDRLFRGQIFRNEGELQRRYVPLWKMIDSIGGEFRYLNMTTLAADTVRLKTIYNHYGFHDATADYEIVLDTARNTSIVRFHIKENTRYPLRAVNFMGMESVPADIRSQLTKLETVKTGKPYSIDQVQAETDRVTDGLRNNGYAFADTSTGPLVLTANIRDRDIFPDAPYDSVLVFIYPGGRFRFGQTSYQTDTILPCTVSEDLVQAQREYEPGDLYSREKLDQTIDNLYALQTFDLVTIDTNRTLSSDSTLGMRITTRLRPQNDLRIAPEVSWEHRGAEFVTNLGLSSTYSRLNAFCTQGHMTITGRFQVPYQNLLTRYPLNQAQGGLAVSYFMPSMPFVPWIPYPQRLSLLSTISYDNTVLDRLRSQPTHVPPRSEVTLRSARWGAVGELSYRFPRYTFFNLLSARLSFQHNTYYGISRYIDRLAEIRVDTSRGDIAPGCDVDSVKSTVRQALINNIYQVQVNQGDDPNLVTDPKVRDNFNALKRTYLLSISAVGDHRDDFFSPTTGYLGELRAEVGLTGGFSGSFIKGEVHHRIFIPVGGWTWASRIHVGVIGEMGSLPLTPIASRFSAGGASSLRGWEAREMLATRPPTLTGDAVQECAEPIVAQIVDENRRLLGGLALLELSTEFRTRIFNLPGSSTLGQQLNELVFIGFADAGNAYFRDKEDIRRATWRFIYSNIGLDVGASVGYNTPVGPFRVGVGVPVYDPVEPAIDAAHKWIWNRRFTRALVWHVGIGHAF